MGRSKNVSHAQVSREIEKALGVLALIRGKNDLRTYEKVADALGLSYPSRALFDGALEAVNRAHPRDCGFLRSEALIEGIRAALETFAK